MEKIVLVSGETKYHEYMIALIKAVFPECKVEIVARPDSRSAAEGEVQPCMRLYNQEYPHAGTGIQLPHPQM